MAGDNRLIAATPLKELATSETAKRLLVQARPMLDPANKLIVVFSPKSACSSVVIWFFNLIGHLKAARDYDFWPHNYRQSVYGESILYRRALIQDHSAYKLIRVVRDPLDRAQSSFRHALATGYADQAISETLPDHDRRTRGLSFMEFIDFLERQNPEGDIGQGKVNSHHALQFHPIEDAIAPHHLINVSHENLFARLNEVEAALGLPHTDFGALSWVSDLQSRREVHKTRFEDAATARLTFGQAKNGPWPDSRVLMSQEARERLSVIYRKDIAHYAKPPAAAAPT